MTDEPISTPTPVDPAPKSRARGCLFEVVETVVLTLLIFLGIQAFVAQPYRIEGVSMQNTLQPDQYLLIDKLTPRWAPYVRGDIVVLDPPTEFGVEGGGTPFIKRVIGVAGDRVELKDGLVYVNDTAIDEPYLFAAGGSKQPTEPRIGQSEWLVPEGDVFVMGDHRTNSSDSRTFGPIKIAHVIGRAWLRYWPVDTFGILADGTAHT